MFLESKNYILNIKDHTYLEGEKFNSGNNIASVSSPGNKQPNALSFIVDLGRILLWSM